MFKKLSIICAFAAIVGISNLNATTTASVPTSVESQTTCESCYYEYYMRTGYSVTIYSESGACKGSYAIYLHEGRKYINFYNHWICIQGKQRFAYSGNWYIIR